MATLSNMATKCFTNSTQTLVKPITGLIVCNRFASKKTGGTTQNSGNSKPKYRGWKKNNGSYVYPGTTLAKQNTTRWHPGLNVGFGRNGNLFAMHPGRVVVTCEIMDANWDHTWIQKNFEGREGQLIYKKYFNVIPKPEHNRFKLIDKI